MCTSSDPADGSSRAARLPGTTITGSSSAFPGPAETPALPERVGAYRILRLIGRGGMGEVYEAEQERPRRAVALKIIKPGAATPEALKRFELEAQVLGRLQHVGIAQIYEAGIHRADTPAGAVVQPYFAMEFVHGQRLGEYAAQRRLTTSRRLELVARIADAVQHAHAKGVIHRDLKPGNILVVAGSAGGAPAEAAIGQPKILDFGVARLTEHDVQMTTISTDMGQMIGTLPYMSPEQVTGDPAQLDTRSDVYALGVVLYELLTGHLPYDVRGKSTFEAMRVIREEEPTRLGSTTGWHGRPGREFRGDIETIVGKALEKDKERRYATAAALAADIRRFLSDEPIAARPPSAAYQVRKFAKRNKALVGGVAATFLVLVAGLITSTTLYLRAEAQRQRAVLAEQEQSRERERAVLAEQEQSRARKEADEQRKLAEKRADETEQVAAFQSKMLSEVDAQLMGARLREDVLAEARAAMERSRGSDEEITARVGQLEALLAGTNFTNAAVKSLDRNVLQRALETIDKQFADQPLVQARLLQTAADTLRELGLYDAATAPQERALQTRRSLLGDDHPDTLMSIGNMGFLLQAQGKLTEAEPLLREALEGKRSLLGDDHPDTLGSINNMGLLLDSQGKLAEAEPFYREALDGNRRVLGDDHAQTLNSINNMGYLLDAQGKLAEAEPFYREALEGCRRVLGDNHPYTLTSINNMGSLLQAQGKLAQAEPYFREALEGYRRVLGDDHPNTLTSINNLGMLLDALGKLAEAEPLVREALERRRRVLGDNHPSTLASIKNMGTLLQLQGKHAEAEPYFREAMEGCRRVLGDDHPNTLSSINNMGFLLNSQGRLAEAEPFYGEALEGCRRVLGDDHPQTLLLIDNMAGLLLAQGKLAEAEPYFREALEGRRRVLGDDHPDTLLSINNMGYLLQAQGKLAEAEPFYREAASGFERRLGNGHWWTGNARDLLGKVLTGLERFAEAEEQLLAGERIVREAQGVPAGGYKGPVKALIDLYEKWHAAEPDQGYDQKAAEWRAKLEEWQASTQPATQPAAP